MSTFTSATGVTITYEVQGDGPLVVLVHGGAADARAWTPLMSVLPNDYRLFCPNRLGYGGSDTRQRRDEPTHWEDGEVIVELLRQEAGPIVLAGHSSGGNVAFDIALKTDLPISHLVLFEPAMPSLLRDGGDHAMYSWSVEQFIDRAVAMARLGDPTGMKIMVDSWSGEGAFQRLPEKVKAYLQNLTDICADDIEACFANTYDLRQLAEMQISTLVITGNAGEQFAIKIANQLISNLPDCSHHVIKGADHSLIATHAKKCAELLAGFSN